LQTGQTIFGVIENMAWFEQPDGSKLEIFGPGGGQLVADRLAEVSGQDVKLRLGQIGLKCWLREGSDSGKPVVLSNPQDSGVCKLTKIAELLARDPRDLSNAGLNFWYDRNQHQQVINNILEQVEAGAQAPSVAVLNLGTTNASCSLACLQLNARQVEASVAYAAREFQLTCCTFLVSERAPIVLGFSRPAGETRKRVARPASA
jgi:hypothetical protein